MSPLRVAIVGLGPKGTHALERLRAHQLRSRRPPPELTIFEPHPDLGAGPVYDRRQPDYLLMNYPADRIDLSWRGEAPPSAYRGGSFVEWSGCDLDRAAEWFPPRSAVGNYLAEGAGSLLRSAPFPLELVCESAKAIDRTGGRWSITSASGERHFDEILLATGHRRSEPDPLAASRAVEPGSHLAVRGFGLTAIDLIIELTEGRGGGFESDGDGSRLRFRGSSRAPARIAPWSRSGRPMLVKPTLALQRRGEMGDAIDRAREAVVDIPGGRALERLIGLQATVASELLAPSPGSPEPSTAIRAAGWLRLAATGSLPPDPDPLSSIAASLAIGNRSSPPGLAWALGAAWRESYPAIVSRFSHGGIPVEDRTRFLRLAAEQERLAFGPPPINAAKIIALAEAGVVDLSRLAGGHGSRARGGSGRLSESSRAPGEPDFSIDAVIPPPGLHPDQPPFDSLLAEGWIRPASGLRGIEVDRSAGCIGADGRPSPGLSACGRITEDWVIGNDTLSRSLHPELDRWAAELTRTPRSRPASPVPSGAG